MGEASAVRTRAATRPPKVARLYAKLMVEGGTVRTRVVISLCGATRNHAAKLTVEGSKEEQQQH
eukprot:1980888-Pyramimonas_sp.AAC.1